MYANPETMHAGSPDILERLRRRLGGFQDDQNGQTSVYMVMVMF